MEFDADVVFFLGLSVLAAFYYSFRFLRHTRLIEDTPTSRVRSAHQGYVELEGAALPIEDKPLQAPLTNAVCIWWFYHIERKTGSGKNTSWKTVEKKTSDAAFHLEDDTGRCVVNPAGAEVVTTAKQTWYGHSAWPSGLPSGGWFHTGDYRYTERLIPPDAPVYVLGLFQTRSVVMDSTEENTALREKLSEWKQDAERMKLLDVNQDGEVDVKEWEAARRIALMELQREHQTLASEGLHTLSKPQQKNQPFLLSTVLQHDLCRRWRWYAGLCFAWFLIGGALFVWQLIEYGLL